MIVDTQMSALPPLEDIEATENRSCVWGPMTFAVLKSAKCNQKTRRGKLRGKQMGDCAKTARCAGVFSALGFGHVRSLAVIAIGAYRCAI